MSSAKMMFERDVCDEKILYGSDTLTIQCIARIAAVQSVGLILAVDSDCLLIIEASTI